MFSDYFQNKKANQLKTDILSYPTTSETELKNLKSRRFSTTTLNSPLKQYLKPRKEISLELKKQQEYKNYMKDRKTFHPAFNHPLHYLHFRELSLTNANIHRYQNTNNRNWSQTFDTRVGRNVLNKNLNMKLLLNEELHNIYKLPFHHRFNEQNIQSSDYISDIKYDMYGSLFAVCSTSGDLKIFDWDSFIVQWNTKARIAYDQIVCEQKQKRMQSDFETKSNSLENENVEDMRADLHRFLEIQIRSPLRSECISWNKKKENEIIVCGNGTNGGCILVYDLNDRYTNNHNPNFKCPMTVDKCKLELQTDVKHKQSIVNCAIYSSMIYGGCREGWIFSWDMRANSKLPQFRIGSHSSSNTSVFQCIQNYSQIRGQRNMGIKKMHISNDGQLLFVVRENGAIEILDVRMLKTKYKSIDLWTCPTIVDNDNGRRNAAQVRNRAMIDDAVIVEDGYKIIVKLQNSSLISVNINSETIVKTVDCQSLMDNENDEVLNVSYLSNINQRRMCCFKEYGESDIIISGSMSKHLMVVDMSADLDAYFYENEKEHGNIFHKNYGLLADIQLDDILMCVDLHPTQMFSVCGTYRNTVQIVGCGSSPLNE